MKTERCVICGDEIPEGRQICSACTYRCNHQDNAYIEIKGMKKMKFNEQIKLVELLSNGLIEDCKEIASAPEKYCDEDVR